MSRRGRIRTALIVAVGLAVSSAQAPAAASAHAYLVRTTPAASGILNAPPATVALTFDEAVEPRFAIISVTDTRGTQETTASARRSAADPDTLLAPLRPGLPQGWYLVYWRAISVDGHPVQGAYTYSVGPNPGPAPQFSVPSVSSTAVTPALLITRWIMFLSVMSAIGLLVLRLIVARPAAGSLRALTRASIAATVIGLITIPVYLDVAIAEDSLRSVLDLGALVPLYRVTAFGRGYVDLEICFGLFAIAAGIALWVDRPDRPRRSVAELAAGTGVLAAIAAVLLVPPSVGHASQASPRGLSVALDAVHLLAGSVWVGGLIGLLVVWAAAGPQRRVAVLGIVVPRFSAVALTAVIVLLASGTGSTVVHMPAVNALWDTSYGVAILVKIGLLTLAVVLASGN
ncbi:MAG: copper resistance protein CopC/CopD, partial [Actinomycetota bacterium]|nr:copper resistance protein CopC/CopD [Actinomycetota bacterium]